MEDRFYLRARIGDLSFDPDSIKFYGYQVKSGKRFVVNKPLELETTEEPCAMQPFLIIEKNEAQLLMNDLWDCGLRPSEGSGSACALAAIQKHLKDMKTIAFQALKIQGE